MQLDTVAREALTRLDVSSDSDDARRVAIAHAEPIVLAAMAETRWDLVVDLASALADAYAVDDAHDQRREWAGIALDASRTYEGDEAGPATLAALERVGQAELERGELEASHSVFLEALDVAERAFGPEAPVLIDLLLCAGAGATPDFAVDLTTRALDLAEQHEHPLLPVLLEVSSAMLDAERAEDAVPYATRAVELAAQDEDDDGSAHGLLAQALLAIDRPGDARQVLARVSTGDDPWLRELQQRALASHEQVTRRLRPMDKAR